MGSPLADVVHGYTKLASSQFERWSEHASKVAAKLDAGTYDADGAVADLVATASLATESGVLLALEALDAVAILTGRQHRQHVVESSFFSTALAGATLALAGPLVNGFGDELPVDVIVIEPPALAAKATDFCLRADATGHRSGTYLGAVDATAAGKAEQVAVRIVVP